ncbi:MAG: MipA/OmpV family protein [Oleispira sp.]|nr:MipA/OmpV family protein [Oleispira sp.]MBL4881378.1 MipA/OmpV family protein [Oleispira sp.]
MNQYTKLTTILPLLLLSAATRAEDSTVFEAVIEPAYGLWSVAAVSKKSQFKSVDNQFSPSLLIFGGYGPIFIEANRFGYNYYRDGTYFSSMIGNVRGHSSLSQENIDSSDVLQRYNLDERKTALEAGIQFGRRFDSGWVGRLALLQDISSTHKAQEAELSFYRRDNFKPLANFNSIRLLTTVAAQAQSQELNDYYYGVDSNELGISGAQAYQADAGWSVEIELIATYDFSWQESNPNKNWGAYAGLRHYQFSDTVNDSPIIESGLVQQYFVGLGTYF